MDFVVTVVVAVAVVEVLVAEPIVVEADGVNKCQFLQRDLPAACIG